MQRIRNSGMKKTYSFVFHIALIIQTVAVIRYRTPSSVSISGRSINVERLCFIFSNFIRCDYKDLAAARLENVTQTIGRVLEGYDIRLRPDFGGKFDWMVGHLCSALKCKCCTFRIKCKKTSIFVGEPHQSRWSSNFVQSNFMLIAMLCFPIKHNPFDIKHSGDPLRVGMDLTIASFDAISEVNMVSV